MLLGECALGPEKLNVVFRKAAVTQYQKEVLFSALIDVMTGVVLTTRPSVNQSFCARRADILPIA